MWRDESPAVFRPAFSVAPAIETNGSEKHLLDETLNLLKRKVSTVGKFVAHIAKTPDGLSNAAVGTSPKKEREQLSEFQRKRVPLAIASCAHLAFDLEQVARHDFVATFLDPGQ